MDSTDLHRINSDLDALKNIFKCPRVYLTDHFADLTLKVDLEAEMFLLTKDEAKESSQSEIKKVVKNRELMLEKINEYQRECLDNCPPTFSFGPNTSIEIALIETKLNELRGESMMNQIESDESNEHLFNKFTQIESLINSVSYKLQQVIFGNKCILFIQKDLLDGYVNSKTFFGKLIFIKDAFFGRFGLENLM